MFQCSKRQGLLKCMAAGRGSDKLGLCAGVFAAVEGADLVD